MINDFDWLVVAGGPGISNKYMKIGLELPLASFKLHYFKQLGSPELLSDNIPTLDEMVWQILDAVSKIDSNNIGLICHSFSSYLCIRAIEKNVTNIKAFIMICPMPFEFSQWEQAMHNIEKNIPKNELDKIKQLEDVDTDGKKVFAAYFPYYIVDKSISTPVDISFNSKMCNTISEQIPIYNDVNFISSLPFPVFNIVGEEDFFHQNNYYIKTFNNIETIVIPNTGHYPFLENPEVFSSAIKIIRSKLCLIK